MNLVEECILALGDNIHVYEGKYKERIIQEFCSYIPMTSWFSFDWNKISNKKTIENLDDIINLYPDLDRCYIIWDYVKTPIILCDFIKIVEHVDDVTAVSTNTWLMSEDRKYFIEIYHETKISIAVL